jgi:hypothetical protein
MVIGDRIGDDLYAGFARRQCCGHVKSVNPSGTIGGMVCKSRS